MPRRSWLRLAVLTASFVVVAPGVAAASTITVTTTADAVATDGVCSLREAVTAANANTARPGPGECTAGEAAGVIDRIVLPAGTYRRSIGGGGENANATGDLDITSRLEIVGAGSAVTVIDAAGLDRVVQVLSTGTSVRIADLTITGGVAPPGIAGRPIPFTTGDGGAGEDGGGVRSVGTLTLERVRVVGNTGGAGGDGADISEGTASGGAPAQSAGGGNGGGGGAGGISSGGTLTLAHSEVSGNRGGAGGAGGDARGGNAGGGGTLAEGGAGLGGAGGDGGAGGIDGGDVTIRDSLITGNQAGPGGDGGSGTGGNAAAGGAGADGGLGQGGRGGEGGDGGGVRVVATAVIDRTTIASNLTGPGGTGGNGRGGVPSGTADFGAGVGGAGGGAGSGGGIVKFNTSSLTLQNVTITANATAGGGGGGGGGFGITLGPGSAGGPGGAGGAGGGIANDAGATTASFLTITGNGAGGTGGTGNSGVLGSAGATGPAGTPGAGAGSGIDSNAAMSLSASIISGNACGGVFFIADGGANLAQAALGCPGVAADPRLGALAANGGTPPTQALGSGSAAIDRASGAGCPATDARGAVRPAGSGCDAGAFELAPPLAGTGGATPSVRTAVLEATVQTRGLPASVSFEFGATAAYGSTTPPVALAGSATPSPVSATIGGLTPGRVYHYRVVVRGQDGTATGGDRTFTAGSPSAAGASVPRVTAFAASPRRFAPVARGGVRTPARAGRPARGTIVTFSLSERARVRLQVIRTRPGRSVRVGGRTVCRAVARPAGTPRARRCVAVRPVGVITRQGVAGRNRIILTGRLGGRALAVGAYRLTLTATDADGLRSAAARTTITILAARAP